MEFTKEDLENYEAILDHVNDLDPVMFRDYASMMKTLDKIEKELRQRVV